MVRVFLTGATGYVGGDVLYRLQQSSVVKSQLTCLVRDASKAKQLSATYPDVEIIQGGLDDSDLVEQEAKKADVVLSPLYRTLILLSTLTAHRPRSSRPRRCCVVYCKGIATASRVSETR